jgi:hypothetical protein
MLFASRTEFSLGAGQAMNESQLQALLRNAIASFKMVVELEKVTPDSPLVGIWKCTAKAAHAEYVCAAIKLGMSVSDIAAKLGVTVGDITTQLDNNACL